MIPADADEVVLTSEEIKQKYKVTDNQFQGWTVTQGFPEAWPDGPGRTLVRDGQEVDDWLRKTFPVIWAQGQDSDNPHGLPEGGPKDLLSLQDLCELEAKVLGRDEPVPRATLRGYLSKGKMPEPDRTPGDGVRPEVSDRMWFRRTAYEWLNRPRSQKRVKAVPADAGTQPAEPASAPAKKSEQLDVDGIVDRYGVIRPTATQWTRTEGFPPTDGAFYDAAAVDAWVRSQRPRTWQKAQQSAAPAAASSADSPVPGAGEQEAKPPARAGSRRKKGVELTLEQLGPRYGSPVATGVSWTRAEERREGGRVVQRAFPQPLRRNPRVWDQDDVDAWVEEARPHVWASFTGSGPALVNPLPEGNPRDLLDVNDFAEVWGNATRGEPLEPGTVASYHSRGQIPFADRAPDDGKTPRVLSYHWYRQTVYDVITSRRGMGNFEPR
ncbi:hypothetical protein ABZ896_22980 [Streptomyces sp. NPDC047072]|uniref:hypothetical protein n=1 Tax=Streptomyces sp. NPDC047072 TaxID=3154809 RepID=UPI0033EDD715